MIQVQGFLLEKNGLKAGMWIRIRLDPHSFGSVDLHSECGSGSRGIK